MVNGLRQGQWTFLTTGTQKHHEHHGTQAHENHADTELALGLNRGRAYNAVDL